MPVDARNRDFDVRRGKHRYRFSVFADVGKFQSHFLKHCVVFGGKRREEWIDPAPETLKRGMVFRNRLSRLGCPVIRSKSVHDWETQNTPCGICGLRAECFDVVRDGLDAYALAAASCIETCFVPETVRHAHLLVGGRRQVACLSDGFVKVFAAQTGPERFNVLSCHSVLDHPPSSEMLLRNKRVLKILDVRKDLIRQAESVILCSESRWCPTW
jgi:hypothetical protein